MDNKFFNQQPLQCEKSSSSQSRYFWPQRSFSVARNSQLSQRTALVQWVTHVIQRASRSNLRYYVAALFIAGLAPCSRFIYLIFDQTSGGPETYWNYYYYFHDVGKDICGICLCVGAFVFIKEHKKVRWVFAAVAAFLFTVVCSTWKIDSNIEYHAFPTLSLIIACVCVMFTSLKFLDFLIWYYNHRTRAKLIRIQSVASGARTHGIDHDLAFRTIGQEATELMASI